MAKEMPLLLYGQSGAYAADYWTYNPAPSVQCGCNLALWNASMLPYDYMWADFAARNMKLLVLIPKDPRTQGFVDMVNACKDRPEVWGFTWFDEPNLRADTPPALAHAAARKFRELTTKPIVLNVAFMGNQVYDERDYLGIPGVTGAADAFDFTTFDYYLSMSNGASEGCTWHASMGECVWMAQRLYGRYTEMGFSKSGSDPRMLGLIQGALNNPVCPGAYSTLTLDIMKSQTNAVRGVSDVFEFFSAYAWFKSEFPDGRSQGLVNVPENRIIVKDWADFYRNTPVVVGVETGTVAPPAAVTFAPSAPSVQAGQTLVVVLGGLNGRTVTSADTGNHGVATLASVLADRFTLSGVSAGGTDVDVVLSDGSVVSVSITVTAAGAAAYLDPNAISLTQGQQQTVMVRNLGARAVTGAMSSNVNVATVTRTNVDVTVTGVALTGTATITITLSDGSTLGVTVTVTAAAVSGVTLTLQGVKLAPRWAEGQYAGLVIQGDLDGVTYEGTLLLRRRTELQTIDAPLTMAEAMGRK